MKKVIKCKLCSKDKEINYYPCRIGTSKGKYCSEKCRREAFSISCREKVKEKHYNWKGGKTANDKLERHHFNYNMQKQVFERDNYTCQFCGVRGVALQVDHIQPWAEYVKGRFCMDNCRTLCQKCHYKITWGKEMPENIKTWGHNLKTLGYNSHLIAHS